MGSRIATILLLAAGCNQVFDLHRTELVDGALGVDASLDVDGDGILVQDDDCPEVFDPAQHDEDGDGVGDVCDPCPLDASTAGDVDGDGLGDACDPRPSLPGDCLVLFDSFQSFDNAAWNRVAGTTVSPGPDKVLLTGSPRGGISPKGLTGTHSVRFRADGASFSSGGYIGVMDGTTVGNTDAGYQCRVDASSMTLVNVVNGAPPTSPIAPPLTGETFTWSVLHDQQPARYECLIERAATPVASTSLIQMGAGGNELAIITVGTGTTLTLHAIAVFERRQGTSCPAPVFR